MLYHIKVMDTRNVIQLWQRVVSRSAREHLNAASGGMAPAEFNKAPVELLYAKRVKIMQRRLDRIIIYTKNHDLWQRITIVY